MAQPANIAHKNDGSVNPRMLSRMLLNANIELRDVNPQTVLSTFDIIRAAIACTLYFAAATPQFTSVYYEPSQTLMPAPEPVLPIMNCSALNSSVTVNPGATLQGGRVVIWYTFPNTTEIMSMDLVQFNTLMTYSPYIQTYKQIVGSTGIIAAGPVELLHLPGPATYIPLASKSESLDVSSVSFALLTLVCILITQIEGIAE